MLIKSITIQGFKSYRDQIVIDPFSEKVNVVVGKNGSGKSNFFSAIRFVLADDYTSLRAEDRPALLSRGTSTTSTFSAYVEIVFDNADNRFPTGKSEVILRRTIGAKKDEYSLDRKTTQKSEVLSLLESAGFSRSNPYFIVPQGRITTITNMKDAQRLEMLKEVAGTKVYETRRQESMLIIKDTDSKRAKVQEVLEHINERLEELDEEKEELKQYQTADRDRRSLEYAIYSRELSAASTTLQNIEAERASNANDANAAREASQKREQDMARIERDTIEAKESLAMLDLEHKQADADRRDATKAKTQIDCTIEDLEAAHALAHDLRKTLEADLESVRRAISAAETSLMEVAAEWEDAIKAERKERETIEAKAARCDALYSKQGRTQRFANRGERDRCLESEIRKLRDFVEARGRREVDLSRELKSGNEVLAETSNKSKDLRAQMETRSEAMQQLKLELEGLRSEMNEGIEHRKTLWKEDSRLDQTVQHARQELQNAERGLMTTMDKGTSSGLRAVKRIAEELGLEGYYGPLYELFAVNEAYRTAAEATAGSSLFHVVVDTDDTASRILSAMLTQKAGRVTFMPLNRLRVKPVTYPPRDDAIFVKLIDKLQLVDPARDIKAFEQVFSRTVVCKSLDVGRSLVHSHGLSIITADGDRIDRKGAVTGGFHDVRRSRLDAIDKAKFWSKRFNEANQQHVQVKRKIVELDQTITRLTGKVQIAESQLRQSRDGRASYAAEALELQRDEEQQTTRRDRLEREHIDLVADVKRLRDQMRALEEEKSTPMSNRLSENEAAELEQLTVELPGQKDVLSGLTTSRIEVESRKSMLEIDLNEKLRRRREELESRIETAGNDTTGIENDDAMATDALDARQAQLRGLEASILQLTERIGDIDEKVERTQAQVQKMQADLEKLQTEQLEDGRSIAKQQKVVERYHARRRVAQQRIDDCHAKIRELGVLPEEAFGKYNKHKMEQLFKELHKTNETLKKFSHVNKKAFEQYNNFTKQREELDARQEELDKSYDSINELIETLDMRKDEAIARTFRQVAQNFAHVFEKIVPAGRGELIMQKHVDHASIQVDENGIDEEEEDGDETQKQKPQKRAERIEHYTGISINVSFSSKLDEGHRIHQLSGGQKAVVALAMVFAIQMCDPAPFYLFDEIDANLDADRRTGVAAMIAELSQNAQFIITTFRPEMLVVADYYLGVTFNDKQGSNVKPVSLEVAKGFIEANEQPGPEAGR